MAKIGDFDIRFQGADARLLALGRIAFALFLYLRYLSSVVLTHVSGFKIQVSGVGQVCCRRGNRIRPVFVFAIFILDRADACFTFQVSRFRFQGLVRFVAVGGIAFALFLYSRYLSSIGQNALRTFQMSNSRMFET